MPRSLPPLVRAAQLTWLNTVAASPVVPSRLRTHLLRLGGVRIRAAVAGPHMTFISGSNVTVGAGSFVGPRVLFDAQERIEIGDRVFVGPDVLFVTSSHEMGPSWWRAGKAIYAPIIVEEGSWVGAGVVILGGVTIGSGCVIEAGSLVNRDCESKGIYTGIPARRK